MNEWFREQGLKDWLLRTNTTTASSILFHFVKLVVTLVPLNIGSLKLTDNFYKKLEFF